jgi:hypothetical protein
MNGPDEVRRVCISESEAEFSLGVSLGVANFFHPGGKLDKDDFVSSGWFVGRAIGDGAFQGSGG